MNHTPEALQLARELDTKAQALGCPLDRFSDALRHQHTRIAELEAENKSLRALASGGIDLFERYSTFKAKCAELEAMLDAVGAGGVGESIKPKVQADTAQAPEVRIRTSAQDGWKLVPVEPTDDMFIEGMEADCRGRPSIDDDNHVRSIWRAMLSSAPDAPPPPAAQQAPLAGTRCKIIDNCKSCQHSAGRQSCMLANRAFEGRERPPTPPDWCPLPLYTAPKPPAQSCCTCTKTADLHKAHEPAPQQKPVAWMYDVDDEDEPRLHFYEPLPASNVKRATPLYTAPQPTRQPLKDEELYSLYCEAMKGYYVSSLHYWRDTEAHKFARAIEAAVANQPPRQPLTDSQVKELVKKQPAEDLCRWSYGMGIKDAEAAHGIIGGQP